MALHRRAPRSLAAALSPLQEAVAPKSLLAEVQSAWPAVVGDVFAAEAQPLSEHGGMLTVRCSSAVWAQELDLLSRDVIDRLNPRLTRGRITRLRCLTDGR